MWVYTLRRPICPNTKGKYSMLGKGEFDYNRPRGYKTFVMLNSAEHEIFSANKYENANNMLAFSYLLTEKFSCLAMFRKKEFAIVSNLRFISWKNFMLSWVEPEKVL